MKTCEVFPVQAGQSTKGRVEGSGTAVAKLWPALWGAYGWPYVSLGLLKLFGDALNFAGMVLSSTCILSGLFEISDAPFTPLHCSDSYKAAVPCHDKAAVPVQAHCFSMPC